MANRNTKGFGLIPAGTLAGVSVQNQGKYKIDAGHSTTIYNGEAVKSASGYVVGGQGSAAPVIGTLNGIFFNAADTLKPTFSNFYPGSIAAAGLDVFNVSPLPEDNPLWGMGNVFITPFTGGRSDMYAERILTVIEPNLRAYVDGKLQNMINIVKPG